MGTTTVRFPELCEQPGHEVLACPAKSVFAGKSHCQPKGQQGTQKERGHRGWVSLWVKDGISEFAAG